MGAKESRPGFIAYEDAVKRVSDGEVRRLREAHRRASGGAPALAAAAFYREVLAEAAPPKLADRLYAACGGGPRRGLHFKDLLCGLVLLTKGTQHERINENRLPMIAVEDQLSSIMDHESISRSSAAIIATTFH